MDSRDNQTVSTDSLVELADLVLKNNYFEFNNAFYRQLRGTAIGTKCAPPYAILFLAELENRLLQHAVDKPMLCWRYIDNIFLVWQHGEDKLLEFVSYLNSAHSSIKFTAEWSKSSVNFLDVRVVKKDNTIVTDLYSKPTDTHQLLHRSSCHPGHTKKGIPYGQALRLRRICSEDSFFLERSKQLKSWLLDRGYKGAEVDREIDRAKHLDRGHIIQDKNRNAENSRIALVLTYHPALNKVYEILQNCLATLCVDDEHRRLFEGRIFLSFRRAKNLKDTLVRSTLSSNVEERVENGSFKCNGRKSCQICSVIKKENTFSHSDNSKVFIISQVVIIVVPKTWYTCCNVPAVIKIHWQYKN